MKKIILLVALSVSFSAPAMEHHSFAMFDRTRKVTLVGVVREFQWANPHAWIQVKAPGQAGEVEWGIECGSPNMMARQGWRSTLLKPGDKVTIEMHPRRDGAAFGSLVNLTLPDGKVMGPGAGPPPPPTAS
jgi:hypothetical protein